MRKTILLLLIVIAVSVAEESSYAKAARELAAADEIHRQRERVAREALQRSWAEREAQEKKRREANDRANLEAHKAAEREQKRLRGEYPY